LLPVTKAERSILHVDMDAFYASVEQLDHPELRGQPVIVGGTSNRGVVAAASYEARAFGVRSAMPVRRAMELCPRARRVPVRMTRYREVSAVVFAIFRHYTDCVQGLSLDEAYLDVTGSVTDADDIEAIGRAIRRDIRTQTGLTASVGMAHNMLLAKIASDLDKPDGFVRVRPEEAGELLAPLPVGRLAGIGPRTAARLNGIGIETLAQLHAASEARLRPVAGNDVRRLRERAIGIDHRAVTSEREDRSVSAEDTFEVNITRAARLQEELESLTQRVVRRLGQKGLMGGLVRIKIRRADFSTQTRQRRISPPTDDPARLAAVAAALLDEWIAGEERLDVRLLGMGVGALSRADQLDLFA
jgi:DNA polymerase-4